MNYRTLHAMKKLLPWLLLPVVVFLSSCSQEAPRVNQRLIIVGFDGMDPVLAQQWMDDGSLPNFRKLAAMGDFAPLPTSNPPIQSKRVRHSRMRVTLPQEAAGFMPQAKNPLTLPFHMA